ncbi:MAG: hypothetical protein ACR2NN_19130 [Bryobacteraceae bacterium]
MIFRAETAAAWVSQQLDRNQRFPARKVEDARRVSPQSGFQTLHSLF